MPSTSKRPRVGNLSRALAVLNPQPTVAPGFTNGHLAATLIGDLADQFDPPQWQADAQEVAPFKPPDFVNWCHSNFIDPVSKKLIRYQEHQQRILSKTFEMIWSDMVTTVVYAATKKSGKTAVAGAVGAYWGENIEAPNEVISIANDQEQAQGRIYAAMVPTMKRLHWNVPEMKPMMTNPATGSVIKAIGTNYAGEAGGNYGLTLWSELWAYTSEARQRLWEEMTQVPTRRYSITWVETYAGYKKESKLLWNVYRQAFKDGDESQPLGVKIKGLEDLPVWFLEDSGTLVYWDHKPRMPWQTPRYYQLQRIKLRPLAYKRLHGNEWVSSEDIFIEPSQWDALEHCETLDMDGDARPIVLGADAGIHNDYASLVACAWDDKRQGPDIVKTWVWRPKEIEGVDRPTIDLEETIGAAVSELLKSGNFYVLAVFYDSYQLHSIMLNLQKSYDRNGMKKLFVDFPQTTGRIKSDQYLYQVIVSKLLRHDGNPELREHVLNAAVDASTRGFRLVKESGKKDKKSEPDFEENTTKIDAAVAGAMAAYGASVRNRGKRGFLKA